MRICQKLLPSFNNITAIVHIFSLGWTVDFASKVNKLTQHSSISSGAVAIQTPNSESKTNDDDVGWCSEYITFIDHCAHIPILISLFLSGKIIRLYIRMSCHFS